MRELFIYYRTAARHAERVRAAVRAWQAALSAAHPALVARLLRRPTTAGSPDTTWMEIYALDSVRGSGDFDEALLAEISAGATTLPALLIGERHVEVFVECAS